VQGGFFLRKKPLSDVLSVKSRIENAVGGLSRSMVETMCLLRWSLRGSRYWSGLSASMQPPTRSYALFFDGPALTAPHYDQAALFASQTNARAAARFVDLISSVGRHRIEFKRLNGGPAGIRTPNQGIMSPLL
jgi:hypothetical protein